MESNTGNSDALMQERRKSAANALKLRLFCPDPSLFSHNRSFWFIIYLHNTILRKYDCVVTILGQILSYDIDRLMSKGHNIMTKTSEL